MFKSLFQEGNLDSCVEQGLEGGEIRLAARVQVRREMTGAGEWMQEVFQRRMHSRRGGGVEEEEDFWGNKMSRCF